MAMSLYPASLHRTSHMSLRGPPGAPPGGASRRGLPAAACPARAARRGGRPRVACGSARAYGLLRQWRRWVDSGRRWRAWRHRRGSSKVDGRSSTWNRVRRRRRDGRRVAVRGAAEAGTATAAVERHPTWPASGSTAAGGGELEGVGAGGGRSTAGARLGIGCAGAATIASGWSKSRSPATLTRHLRARWAMNGGYVSASEAGAGLRRRWAQSSANSGGSAHTAAKRQRGRAQHSVLARFAHLPHARAARPPCQLVGSWCCSDPRAS